MTATSPAPEQADVIDREQILLGGTWVAATGDTLIDVINPATEQVIARVREPSVADVDRAIQHAREAFDDGPWPSSSPEQRARAIDALADGLQARAAELSALATQEGGMPIAFADSSVERAVSFLRYYADQARSFPFRTDRKRPDGGTTRIVQEPVGVVAAIAPWNGPLAVAALKLGPALAAGCTILLKSAPETPLTTYVLAEAVAEAVAAGDLPEGVVSVITGGREIGQAMVAHPQVDKISFTGSTVAGQNIMAAASERVARLTLELGGKSAAIIAEDADLAAALTSLIPMSCGNTGQMCFALTRVLVPESRHDEIVEALRAGLSSLVVGDPADPATTTGPLVSGQHRARVEGYLALAREEGARVVLGGGRPRGFDKGYYIEPTLLDGVANSMRVAQEEIFGPVVSVITYRDIDEALRIANDSRYGLAGSIYTADHERGFELARRVRTGTITVNGAIFDTTVPFGGFKYSGIGREGGPEGLAAYTETKSVHMTNR
ncbi:betaine-aldehyde dehydrogenase [Amycolatopsis bartoniae]|uniref:Aldehyde dehydrogenase n=1 Tax=Amycolatopsis bartoniae TaxID=941986 RepID=A0A8H9IR75_9PSEU|nr:aldehyde dehydrogenase [Amycolatopsis bartoniae]MBB2939876.1 betaine-aldehyde dehydrogenase [Amycolatopsis bartoniae]TVT08334.1 aldehyde dehydrogenase [Amycolatopsis bartoniae]GHF35945.1 aldehyde dehydrogenase [Amycolatopsis bartoniae]